MEESKKKKRFTKDKLKNKKLFLMVSIFLFVALALIGIKVYKAKAYTQTAWPQASDNYIIVRMAGPKGDGGIQINAKTSWVRADKTKSNFENKQRTITLSQSSYNNNPYGASLKNTSVKTTKSGNGGYSVITFTVNFTVPEHYTAYDDVITKSSGTTGRYKMTYSLSHKNTAQTIGVTFEVNLSNFGMIVNSNDNRAKGGNSVIKISRPSYNVGFNANGGNGGTTRKGLCWCEYATAPSVSKPYSKFAGWYNAANGGSYICGAGGSVSVNTYKGQTLYAHWSANDMYVSYNPGVGGTWISSNSDSVHIDKGKTSSYQLYSGSVVSRDNYTFVKWNTVGDGSGTSYSGGQSIDTSKTPTGTTLNLYAIWRRNDYDVIFDPNGGSGSMPNQTIKRDASVALNACTGISKKGYIFVGWNTDPHTMTVKYKDQATVQKLTEDNETFTLYAVWQKVGTGFVQRPLLDTKMFYKTAGLVGGNGTLFDPEKIDSFMAHIDTADNPGYFTKK